MNHQKREIHELHLTLGSYLHDVDTLQSSDPAWGLLVPIVAQTKLSIAIVAPTIDLHTQGTHLEDAHSYIKALVVFCTFRASCFLLLLAFTCMYSA